MSKVLIWVVSAVGAVVVIGVIVYFVVQNNAQTGDQNTANTSQTNTTNSEVQIVDPNGDYKVFSDASITKHPEDGFVFGGGEPFMVTYDGSKSENNQYATLSYQLYYVQDNGTVVNFTGGNLEGTGGKGDFSTDADVFTSDADGRKGFVEVVVTYGVTFDDASQSYKGTTNKLGMYPVKFKVTQ